MPVPALPEPYERVDVLRSGAVTGTCVARNRRTGDRVVIKYVDSAGLPDYVRNSLSGDLRFRVSAGAGRIATVDHQEIVLIRPYVEGTPLRQILDQSSLTVIESLTIARLMLCELSRLHEQGTVHRGLKPSNVIVSGNDSDVSVTLVDPSSAPHELLLRATRTGPDTLPRYMAPEVAGVLDRPADGRSDLYSTGVVLFECLAGKPPFRSANVREMLHHHLSTPVPPLRSLGVAVPQALEEIIRRFLHKDPDDRYQSAIAALADVAELHAALEAGVVEPGLTLGTRDQRMSLTEPPLTGRQSELALLARRADDARRGFARSVIIEAVSGGGKTRVLDEFCQRATASGARVFRGNGIDRSARPPLHMFDGIVADLLRHADIDQGFGEHIERELAAAAQALRQALPRLAAILGEPGEPSPRLGEQLVQHRLITSLVQLLTSLGTATSPAVVVFDDCQWADELTLHVLEAWAGVDAANSARQRHVLLVAAMRTDEMGPHHDLKSIHRIDTLSLPPLDTEQITEVITTMAGKVPPEVIPVVVELSRGNPLMVSAVLRGLVEDAALCPGDSGWQFTPVPRGWQASRESAALLARRFLLLPPLTRKLLDAGAVLGREFIPDLAARLVGEDESAVAVAVDPAIERHLVWPTSNGYLSFAHDRLRASLLASLAPNKLADLHLRAAEEIERIQPDNQFDLAYHFDAAGDPKRAFSYALTSARSARSRHDFEVAERQYLIAERGIGTTTPRLRYALTEELGQVLMLRGHYQQAEERFAQARTLADDDLQLAWIECQLGELAFRRDDLGAAAAHVESGLRALGDVIPLIGNGRILVEVFREVIRRSLLLAHGPIGKRRPVVNESDLLKVHLYTRLQYPRWFHSNRLETFWLMLRQVNLAERCSRTSDQLAHAYSVWGGALALTFPFLWRGALPYVEKALTIYRANGDLRGEGHAASMEACVLHAASRYEEAAQAAERAIHALSQFGDRWELGFATRTRATCLYRLGRRYDAQKEARRLASIGREVGDANAEITALEILAKSADGEVPVIETQAALARRTDDIEVTAAALQAEALRLRRAGQLSEAVQRLRTATHLVSRAQPTSTHLTPVFPWLATCTRELAERQPLPENREQLLRAANRSARRAVRYARIYRNDLPHALRELGIVHALNGNLRRARHYLSRSATRATQHNARAELAETTRQRDRLGLTTTSAQTRTVGDPYRSAPVTLGLAERFTALLNAGALLTSCNSTEETVRAVDDISRTLLRAERTLIVGLRAPGQPDLTGLGTDEVSAIELAKEQARPVILPQPIVVHREPADSSSTELARSALCAPVYARDEIVGYFVALHTQVAELFGQEERQLAEFVARLAGASLERQWLERDSRARVVAAQENERARVARDLHDEIGQALTSVLLRATSVDSAVAGEERTVVDTSEVSRRVRELRQDAENAMHSVQRLAFDMRPAVLDDLGLVAALQRLVARTASRGVQIELETVSLRAGDRLPHDVETTAYRVVQEAVTNVVRHAGATTCGVIIGHPSGRLRIVIEDDGNGFDASLTAPHGLGLLGMRERAALVGGTLTISSTPDHGTEVVFEVPM
jgi:signal transduction histidine kinase/tetratricopeptide (TPR) repeat protein